MLTLQFLYQINAVKNVIEDILFITSG